MTTTKQIKLNKAIDMLEIRFENAGDTVFDGRCFYVSPTNLRRILDLHNIVYKH